MNKSRPVRLQPACTPAEREALKAAAASEGAELGPWVLAVALERAAALGYVPEEPSPPTGPEVSLEMRRTRWARFEAAVRSEIATWAPSAVRALADSRSTTDHRRALRRLADAFGTQWAKDARENGFAMRVAREVLFERGDSLPTDAEPEVERYTPPEPGHVDGPVGSWSALARAAGISASTCRRLRTGAPDGLLPERPWWPNEAEALAFFGRLIAAQPKPAETAEPVEPRPPKRAIARRGGE